MHDVTPDGATCVPDAHGHCSICGDEATLVRVVAVDAAGGTAEVVVGGVASTVAIDLLDEVAVGDAILVHMGFAISRIDPDGEGEGQ